MSLLGAKPGTSCTSARRACPLRSQHAVLMRPEPLAPHHGRTRLPDRASRSCRALASLPAFDIHNPRRTDSIPIATVSGAA